MTQSTTTHGILATMVLRKLTETRRAASSRTRALAARAGGGERGSLVPIVTSVGAADWLSVRRPATSRIS